MKTRTCTRAENAGGLLVRDQYRRFAIGETQSVPLPYTYVRKDGLRARCRGYYSLSSMLKNACGTQLGPETLRLSRHPVSSGRYLDFP
jgi:hypothetical protein